MRRLGSYRFLGAVCAISLLGGVFSSAWAQNARYGLSVRVLADGLKEPTGVAIHPGSGDIYVSEMGSGQIGRLENGRLTPALAQGWSVTNILPRWAISERMPREKWMAATLEKPGAITIASNGTLYVTEQIPNGRILEFAPPNEQGLFAVAMGIPVPWLDQEFQWSDIFADLGGRLFICGADQVGSDFMKFGSSLVREADGDWWVVDFGPFADFNSFAVSDRQDVMILSDRAKGNLAWWEVDRHIMLGGSPGVAGKAELLSVALYPDGSFVLGEQVAPGKAALKRIDPFTGQETLLSEQFQSIGDIAIDRINSRYIVTDPKAGRVYECTPKPAMRFNEVAMRQIVRSVEGMMGLPTEAPAFLNTFFDRLQSATEDLMDEEATHAVNFNLSDIAGKMPIIAGRIRAAVEVEGAEDDPLEEVEFFLLFPSKIVMTETAVTPSLSFFSAKRKSGLMEQTKPVFRGDVGVYRLSGTNMSRIASAPGGLHIPIVACGMDQADGGIYINLSFLGAGIYGDYYLTLFQGAREQRAKLVVKSTNSPTGTVTYEASFMDEATIEGMDGVEVKEKISNLLVSGFGANQNANRSVGWLRLGQFPASMTVAFAGDAADTTLAVGQDGLKEIVDKKRVEMNLETATDIEATLMEPSPSPEGGAPAGEMPESAAPEEPEAETPVAAEEPES